MTGNLESASFDGQSGSPSTRRARGGVFIAALSFAMATGATGTYALGALSPFLVKTFELSAGGVGILMGIIYFVAASTSGILGRRADRVDPTRIVLAGAACSFLAALAFAFAPNVVLLGLFAVLAGLAMAASNPGSNGMIARSLPPGSRGYATGIKQSGATGTGLYIASVMPALAVLIGWRLAALAALVIPILAVVTVLWSKRIPLDAVPIEATPRGVERVGKLRWLGWLSRYALLFGVATGICNGFYVLYASERLGFGAVEAGLVFAVFSLASVCARVLWARLAEMGIDTGLLLLVIGIMGATSSLLLFGAPELGPWTVWCAAALGGASIVGWNALAMVTIMQQVPVNAVGASSARMLRSFFIGLAVGPVMFGVIVELVGYGVGWLLQFVTLVLASIVAIVLGRTLRPVVHAEATGRLGP
jgi:MFS family permease